MNQLKTRAFCAHLIISLPIYIVIMYPVTIVLFLIHSLLDAHGARRWASSVDDVHEFVVAGLRRLLYPPKTVRKVFGDDNVLNNWVSAWKKVITA